MLLFLSLSFLWLSPQNAPQPETVPLSQQLMQASSRGDFKTAQKIVAQGEKVDTVKPSTGETPLFRAAKEGHLPVVRLLIEKGANVNFMVSKYAVSNWYKYTPLLIALSQQHGDVAEYLLAKGANATTQTPDGVTSLRLAVELRNIPLVRQLLKQGVDVNLPYFGSPLCAAVGDSTLVRLLLAHGADPNAAINDLFEDSIFMEAVKKKDLASAKLMLAHGAKVNQYGRYNNRALDFAVKNKDKSMIRWLRKHGAKYGSRIERW